MSKRHLMSRTRIHNIWCAMRERCRTKSYSGFHKYGAKGIKVCEEWETFETFRDWAYANGYSDELTIDRIDPTGNYEPSNCRWVSQKIQQNNRTNNIHLTYKGETHSINEWANIVGVPVQKLYWRYYRNWDVAKIFEQPYRKSPTKIAREG